MTFTYSSTSIVTALAKVRLEIGDTDSASALFTDEEINVYLGSRADNILLTAADLCDVLATRFSREYDFETDDQKFSRMARVSAYRAQSKSLRDRALGSGGVESGTATKVDGYSSEITSRDVAATGTSRSGRVRRGWTNPDLPY